MRNWPNPPRGDYRIRKESDLFYIEKRYWFLGWCSLRDKSDNNPVVFSELVRAEIYIRECRLKDSKEKTRRTVSYVYVDEGDFPPADCSRPNAPPPPPKPPSTR